ncbi:MAG: hypothetical protein ACT4OU_11010 [Hyphomicrobium sp.]
MDAIPGWVEPVLIAAAVVFFLDLIGNFISFSNRFLNALTTALVFAVLFGTLIHLGLVNLSVTTMPAGAAIEAPAAPAPAAEAPAPAPEAAPAAEPAAAPAEAPAPATP